MSVRTSITEEKSNQNDDREVCELIRQVDFDAHSKSELQERGEGDEDIVLRRMERSDAPGDGVIGTRPVTAVTGHENCVLAAVVEPDPASRIIVDCSRFHDIAEVNVPADAAIIAMPTQLHFDHGIACAKRRWHNID